MMFSNKLKFDDNKNINLVCFYSEGPPNDNALALSENKKLILNKASPHFNNIALYKICLVWHWNSKV